MLHYSKQLLLIASGLVSAHNSKHPPTAKVTKKVQPWTSTNKLRLELIIVISVFKGIF